MSQINRLTSFSINMIGILYKNFVNRVKRHIHHLTEGVRPIILSILVCVCQNTFSQQQQKQLNFIDPKAGSYTIFGDIPVSHMTGVPDIEIPLINLESYGFKIPLALKYHIAMVKPPFDYTNIATGWVLDIGGTITQEIKSENDLAGRRPSTFRTDLNISGDDQATKNYLTSLASKQFDGEHDLFSFSLPRKSGKFIIEKTVTSGKYAIRAIDDSHVKGDINTVLYSSSNYTFQNVRLTDEKGYNYIFDEEEGRASSKSYFLKSIKAPNDLSLFEYEYVYRPSSAGSFYLQNLTVTDQSQYITSTMIPGNDPYFPISGNYHLTATAGSRIALDDNVKTVKKVSFESGSIEFTLTDNKYIDALTLKNKNGAVIKTITFNIQHFPGEGYRFLRGIAIKDNATNIVETYSMEYNNENVSVTNNNLQVDYWGYLRGTPGQPLGQIPMGQFEFQATSNQPSTGYSYNIGLYNDQTHALTFGTGGDREPTEYAKIYSLKTVTYPTGGRTEYQFGLNKYSFGNDAKSGGGLRIEKIMHFDENGQIVSQRRYEYEPGQVDFAIGAYGVETENYNVTSTQGFNVSKSRSRTFRYQRYPASTDNRVMYTTVTEHLESGNENSGKTIFHYQQDNKNTLYPDDNNFYVKEQRDHFGNGLLRKKETFKKTMAGYDKISEENFDYTFAERTRTSNVFFNFFINYTFNNSALNEILPWTLIQDFANDIPGRGFSLLYYDIISGSCQLTTKTFKEYSPSGTKTTTETYQYSDGLDKFLSSKIIVNSDGKSYKTSYKYPYSIGYDNSYPYGLMNEKNIIDEPVEIRSETIQEGGTVANTTTRINYNEFGANIFRPETIEESKGFNLPTTRFRYNYDTFVGNLIETKREAGPPVSYLYNNSKAYPLAQVSGAGVNSVFFEGFEDGTGNTVNSARTGHYNYNGNYIKGLTGLDNGTYTLTYWLKQSGGIWTLNKASVQVTANNYTINISGQIDDVRFYPVTAQMTSYTYDPLVGITSKTDAKNETTYFEYDGSQRLITVLDKDRNVKARYCYNYAGQLTNCTVPYIQPGISQQLVYIRAEISNITHVPNNGNPYLSYDNMDTYGDVSIKFFSDLACQSPFILTSNMDIDIQTTYSYGDQYGQGQSSWVSTYNAQAGQSTINLGNWQLKSIMTYYDPWYGPISNSNETRIDVVPKTGVNYQAVETNGNYYY